jgi:TolA-binding protein
MAHAGLRAQNDDAARQLYESGQKLLQNHQDKEALSAFNNVLSTAPQSPIADEALYEIARYQFETVGDLRAADGNADRLLKDYASSDSAPRAQVLKGRIALASASTPDQVNAAIATFDRVSQTYAGSPAVAADAVYYAAEAVRAAGRRDEALVRFGDVARRYPTSPAAARALLRSAPLLLATGQSGRALEVLQHVRTQFPSAPEAATAGDWLTILYRFYVRVPQQQSSYAYANSVGAAGGKIRDFRDLGIGAENHLFIATKSSVVEFGPKGEQIASTDAPNSRGMIIDRRGRPITISEDGGLRVAGEPMLSLATTRPDGRLEPMHLDGGIVTSTGDMIVTNHDQKTLVRFSADGKPKGEFARGVAARRVAVDGLDRVAAFDTDAKSVVIFGRDGQVVTRIPDRGTAYQFKQVMDIAFDRLGHLYVLDRNAIHVFTPQNAWLTTVSVPERSPGSLTNAEALALDSAARLFVFDSRASVVQVYR